MDRRIVLFIDDDPNILKVLQRLLRGSEMTVLTASTPEDALEILKGIQPQVVVSDHQMPGMVGVDLLAQVRSPHGCPDRRPLPGAGPQ